MPNMNFEEDTRHEVSDKVLRTIEKTAYDQDDFGVNKYGTSLHHSLKFDWLQMGLEEVVDLLKYLQCEKDRKAYIIQILQSALRVDEPKEYIETALELLEVEGTGK
jgi:hypothetical protein